MCGDRVVGPNPSRHVADGSWLRPYQAAAVLQSTVAKVWEMVDRGELTPVRFTDHQRAIKLDADEVIARAESPLAQYIGQRIAAGDLRVPRPAGRYSPPVELLTLLDQLTP
jgi:hypothetical protein